ncbi:DUF2971 domain-containing protein [Acetobacteroides hydrogenigenes]|uniref:DUF2971 family protein n=1 Tax=Acetobacteroides hydrogenigenes TaxID=979970 RepID=A0A4V2RQN5_9BACT|nr:DUF2971 domain-containing protein [Acetobacteroides hydrogenigenes]TCN72060.1 Protein of unknown function (DUF2971) [Acetobacteroides hydrogenigenes]
MGMIHHYTTIENLALILRNRNIRFNRLDRVDDLEEGNTVSNGINLSKYVFVSCWTESDEESIPLWKLYADGKSGVRISLENNFFEEYDIKSSDRISVVDETVKSILSFEEMFNKQYIFISFVNDSNFFYRPIEYVDDIITRTENVVQRRGDAIMISFGEVGKYKHKRWAFQDESRFVLTAIPKLYDIDISNPLFSSMVVDSLKRNIELPFDDYFLGIKKSALDKLVVTLCPSATVSQEIMIQSLIKEYAPNAIIKHSHLKQCIKLK